MDAFLRGIFALQLEFSNFFGILKKNKKRLQIAAKVKEMPFIIIFAVCIITLVAMNFKIVTQQTCLVVKRLGKYHAACDAGVHAEIPYLDHIICSEGRTGAVLDEKGHRFYHGSCSVQQKTETNLEINS